MDASAPTREPAPLPGVRAAAVIEGLRPHAPFDQMDDDQLQFLVVRLSWARYPAGSVLLDPTHGPPEWLYLVGSGAVVAEAPVDTPGVGGGRAQLVEGECFPLGALLTARPVLNTYRAIADTLCYQLPARDFQTLLDLSPVFQDFCTRRLAHLLEQSQRVIQAQYAESTMADRSLASRLGDVVRRPPVACAPDTPLREALRRMQADGIGAMAVTGPEGAPLGIFTVRDLLRVNAEGGDLDAPIGRIMTRELVTLAPDAAAHEAALAMARHGIRHILVVAEGRLIGLVSEKDLFSLQQVGIKDVAEGITRANACDDLQRAAQGIRRLARHMLAQGLAAEPLTRLVSTMNDRLTERVIELAGTREVLAGVRWCWLALGSEGRFEQTLATDQDNGIVFEVPEGGDAEEIRARLLPLARSINEELDRCGFPLCKGGVMASNPRWCLTLSEWRRQFAGWVYRGGVEDVLHAAIFFDFRGVHGDVGLARALRDWLGPTVAANPRFLHYLAANALENRPPLGLVRDFVVASGGSYPNTINLKMNGATPFVDAARIYALAGAVAQTNTVERLRAAAAGGRFDPAEAEAWSQAFSFIQLLRLRRQHLEPGAAGEAGNRVDPERLNELDRRILKESFRQARKLQTRLALDFGLYGRV
jgi:CBS domain-containing protein